MKTITICGSMKLKERMNEVENQLKGLGFQVLLPNMEETGDYTSMTESEQYEFKNRMIIDHFNKIKEGDAVLILNDRLKDTDNYIGANSFLEIGFAFSLGKKIFILNSLPQQPNTVEIGGMLPTCLHGDLSKINLN
jgi:nucleoside 2-deoxyribosyltransferase